MKQKLLLSFLTLLFISNSFGQKLTLTDLTNLCNKKNWQDVNQIMLAKGWTYYNSEKGDTEKYSTITWSYNKEDYSDKSQGWFYLYTFDDFPNKISYSVFNKPSYLLIQNSLTINGFKLVDSEIEDEKVISTYSNLGYTLKISNAKRKDDDWNDRSFVSYNITLIKKTGIFDNQNGKKTEYYENEVIKAEYNLVNGKINGLLKFYDENGNLQKTTNYINGVANGKIVEFKENGEKNAEYLISDDAKNGLLTFYENSKISYTANYKNDLKNGLYTSYYYNDDDKNLFLKEYGQYIDDEKNGLWKSFYINGKVEKLLTFTNYSKGLKDGTFQEIQTDSLIIGNYKNDELDGSYKIYRDLKKMLIGGVINTNTLELILITQGQYSQGKKTGNWKNYDLSKSLLNEGNFIDDLEEGEWKYYYPSYVKEDNTREPFSNELYLIENYSKGKLSGKSIRFSSFEDEEYPCDEVDENGVKIDTCKRKVYVKLNEISNYKNGELNGNYELKNSENEIIIKGFYTDNKENGLFTEKIPEEDVENKKVYVTEKGNYKDGKREGKWLQFYTEGKLVKIINYNEGELNGEYIEFNEFDKARFIKQFDSGKLKQLVVNDSLGNKILKFDIFDRNLYSLKCIVTVYTSNQIVSQEYWLKNDEVNHNFFQLDFQLKTGEKTDGEDGYKDGVFLINDLNDRPLVKGKKYKKNKIDLWTYYYYDQDVKTEIKYIDNEITEELYLKLDGTLFSGEFEFLDVEKNIKETRKIKDGLRNGKTTYLDLKTNKIISKETYKDGKIKE